MITANIGKNHVRVYGHAGTAPIGHDLVCAGASTLLYALAVRLQELEDAGAVKGLQAVFRPGFSEIRWENAGAADDRPYGCGTSWAPSLTAEAVAFYAAGMRMLEEDNPGCIRVK